MKKTLSGALLALSVITTALADDAPSAASAEPQQTVHTKTVSKKTEVRSGDVLTVKADHPETYVVVKGDTLWDISSTFLEDPWLWPELWHYNPQVENPHLIYPGDVLRLIWVDGKPRLVKVTTRRGGDVKLSPQMRVSDLQQAIPSIPLDVIAPFLKDSRVVESGVLERAPYVLAGKEGHIIAGAGGDIYARGQFGDDKVYGIYRRGQVFTDPDSGEALGIQARDIGVGKRIAMNDDIATLVLNETHEEIRRGDRLLPQEDRHLRARFEPKAPEGDIEGKIIAVEGGVTQVGHMDVIVVNRGEREGLRAGDVMAIYQTGELVRDEIAGEVVRVPDTRAGLMMVFRAFDKVSYGLVLQAEKPLTIGDKVLNP